MSEKIRLRLVPDIPFSTNLDIDVYGIRDGIEKKRCTIKAEYGKSDIDSLKEKGMSLDDACCYYREWIYDLVKYLVLSDWEEAGGMEETIEIIREKIKDKF